MLRMTYGGSGATPPWLPLEGKLAAKRTDEVENSPISLVRKSPPHPSRQKPRHLPLKGKASAPAGRGSGASGMPRPTDLRFWHVGRRRRKLRSLMPSQAQAVVRSAAPPLKTKPASLGFRFVRDEGTPAPPPACHSERSEESHPRRTHPSPVTPGGNPQRGSQPPFGRFKGIVKGENRNPP